MPWKPIAISTALAVALVAAPLADANAHRGHGFPLFWPFAAAAAVVGTAAVIATAPLRAVAAPPYGYYGPPAPNYYAPYTPPPAYYAPGYYYGAPYYGPR